MAQGREPRVVDPLVVTSDRQSWAFLIAVYDQWIYIDPMTQEFTPGLLEEWSLAPDGLSAVLKVRPGVKFHDGTLLNAEAVKFTFDRLVDPSWEGGKLRVGDYDHTEIIDDLTAKVVFSKPFPWFLYRLAQCETSPVSPAAVKKYGNEEFKNYCIGAGPFKFKEFVVKDHYTLVRNPDYNWSSRVMRRKGPAALDEMRVQVVPEAGTRVAALEAGDVHIVNDCPGVEAVRLEEAGYTVASTKLVGHVPSFYVDSGGPPTDDKRVRQAMGWSLNRQEIVDIVEFGRTEPATTPLAPGTPGYFAELEGKYAGYDPDKANALLDEAGWKVGPSGYREKDGEILEAEIFVFQDIAMAETMQAQWKQVGIKAKPTLESLTVWMDNAKKYRKGNDLRFNRWLATDPTVLNLLYLSTEAEKGYNLCYEKNDKLDEVLLAGQRETDLEKALDYYKQAQEIIMDNQYAINLYVSLQTHAMHASLKQFRTDFTGWAPIFYEMEFAG
jgi:peptide/nickel transport system substrate-binding protein